jgi:acyl-CoA synthetase (AMP-forming)/AMP-acid ligase II
VILSSEGIIRRHVEAGAWPRVTLDRLFRRGVERDPDGIVFRNAGDPVVPGLDHAVSFTDAERRIDALASFFAGVGLKPDTVIGIHLPSSVEAATIVLAALRAGLIVCPLPLHLNRSEMAAVVAAAGIRAIATASEIEGEATGEQVRDVAADAFAIRFVFAVGTGVPDGLVDLDVVLADLGQFAPPPPVVRRGDPADHVAALSLMRDADDRLIVVPHSHNHLVAAALGHALESSMTPGEILLSTMHPAAPAGLAAGLATALVNGGTVAFHHPTRISRLTAAALTSGAARVVIPSAIGAEAAASLPSDIGLSLVDPGLSSGGPPALSAGRAVTDLYTLGGLCLLPVARAAENAAAMLPLGSVRIPRTNATAAVLYETRIKARSGGPDRRTPTGAGELLVAGALVPDAPWPEPSSGQAAMPLPLTADGFVRSGIAAQPEADGARVRLDGPIADLIVVAGHTVSPARLEALLRSHPKIADAAVFPVDAPTVGARIGIAVVPITGVTISPRDLSAFLAARGGSLDEPGIVAVVPEVPRNADGAVLRDALFLSAVA